LIHWFISFCEVAKEIASLFRSGFSGEQCGRLTGVANELRTIGEISQSGSPRTQRPASIEISITPLAPAPED
jgi:hypothetical protein